MAIAERVAEVQNEAATYVSLMAQARGADAIVDVVRDYLASWSEERIARVQRIDAGWAPFDPNCRPLKIDGVLDVRCIRDAIHCHCMALVEAGVPLTPELAELDQFFLVARDMAERVGRSQAPTPVRRSPAAPSSNDRFANW